MIQLTEVQLLRIQLAFKQKQLVEARIENLISKTEAGIHQAMAAAGLDPSKVYTFDSKAFTAVEQTEGQEPAKP